MTGWKSSTLLAAAEAKLGEVTDAQKQRIENQISLWKQAALISYYNY